jgi:thiamine transport system substrate-binding protein
MKKFIFILIIMLQAGCGPVVEETPTQPQRLTVMTHDSFEISEEVLAIFEAEYDVEVVFLKAGDTGTAVNKAALSVGSPLADVFYGVDNTFLSRALEEGVFEAYNSPLLAEIPNEFKLDNENRALPVDYGDVCLNYDIYYFEEHGVQPPADLEDLLEPDYANMLVVQNPATSSPGLAFLFATIGSFGADGYLDFWQGLVDNGLHVVNDWETAYYTEFSRWGGPYPIVVSYGSSPPFEVLYAEEAMDGAPTAVITGAGSCFRQIEFVGILRGTENRELAERWVDFMLSTTFQEDLPWQMYVFPVNPAAQLDQAFQDYLAIPDQPVVLNPADIANQREQWIQAWTELVLR